MGDELFVPEDFVVPDGLVSRDFRLTPLGGRGAGAGRGERAHVLRGLAADQAVGIRFEESIASQRYRDSFYRVCTLPPSALHAAALSWAHASTAERSEDLAFCGLGRQRREGT